MTERIHLFANGYEYDNWEARNCDRCVKAPTASWGGACDLNDAITEAMVTDGTFAPEIVARFGWKPEYHAVLGWPCKEFQAEGKIEPKPAAREMADAGAAHLPGMEP